MTLWLPLGLFACPPSSGSLGLPQFARCCGAFFFRGAPRSSMPRIVMSSCGAVTPICSSPLGLRSSSCGIPFAVTLYAAERPLSALASCLASIFSTLASVAALRNSVPLRRLLCASALRAVGGRCPRTAKCALLPFLGAAGRPLRPGVLCY